MIEKELYEKCNFYLSKAIEAELFQRVDDNSTTVKYNNNPEYKVKGRIIAERKVNDIGQINLSFQDILYQIGRHCRINNLDSIYKDLIRVNIGIIPEYDLTIIQDTINSRSSLIKEFKSKKIQNPLYLRLNSYQIKDYIYLILQKSIFISSKSIFIYSIILIIT
jgi:hypothetical protein